MKKLFILSAIAFGGLLYNTADAQVRVGVNLGFRAQPVIYNQPAIQASPVYGDNDDDYYYLPDLGVYYDVTDQCYFYFDGTEWISSAYLPGQYANYDWRSARRFEVRAFRPYLHDEFYRGRYDGNRFEGWARSSNGGNGYADRDDRNRGGDRNFDRDHNAYDQREQDNRFNNQHADARRGNYNKPAQAYRNNGEQAETRGQQAYGRPAPQSRNDNRAFENRGQNLNDRQHDQNQKDHTSRFGR